jgi:hypothetical protein
MSPPTNNWRLRRTEHRFYAEIVTDIITIQSGQRFLRRFLKLSQSEPIIGPGRHAKFQVQGFMLFNATFNNISVISWWSVLLVTETRGPGENH